MRGGQSRHRLGASESPNTERLARLWTELRSPAARLDRKGLQEDWVDDRYHRGFLSHWLDTCAIGR